MINMIKANWQDEELDIITERMAILNPYGKITRVCLMVFIITQMILQIFKMLNGLLPNKKEI
jgi:hypothetical protein